MQGRAAGLCQREAQQGACARRRRVPRVARSPARCGLVSRRRGPPTRACAARSVCTARTHARRRPQVRPCSATALSGNQAVLCSNAAETRRAYSHAAGKHLCALAGCAAFCSQVRGARRRTLHLRASLTGPLPPRQSAWPARSVSPPPVVRSREAQHVAHAATSLFPPAFSLLVRLLLAARVRGQRGQANLPRRLLHVR